MAPSRSSRAWWPASSSVCEAMTATNTDMAQSARFEPLPPDRPADAIEQELLAQWEQERLFDQQLAANAESPSFVFFEGPPTANGRPGIHHVFARTIKDLFCRYRAMKGFRVERKAGWDTHGLPVEIEVEKQLGISGKQQIEAIGVAEFNRLCRESVFRYRADWERLSARIGFWLDYAHPYITYTNNNLERVWGALKTLYERELLSRGHKILPYCPRCGTALSSHEVAQGYEEVEDPSVYIKLPLRDPTPSDEIPESPLQPGDQLVVWTTTPWTLISNAAVAVGPDVEYARVRPKGAEEVFVVAASLVERVFGEGAEVLARFPGNALAGARYEPPFSYVTGFGPREHTVLEGDFVSTEEGTGLVHTAIAFGEDDFRLGEQCGLTL